MAMSDFAEFREALEGSGIDAVAIHAIYLINGASTDRDIKRKSNASLVAALRLGDAIGADGVVLHAGARKGKPHAASMRRAGRAIAVALGDSDQCPLLLENTAGRKGHSAATSMSSRSFSSSPAVTSGSESASIPATSSPPASRSESLRHSVSSWTSWTPRSASSGSSYFMSTTRRSPSAAIATSTPSSGRGSSDDKGIATFLSEPRFEDLPAVIETGVDGGAPAREDVRKAKRLRREGLRSRAGA